MSRPDLLQRLALRIAGRERAGLLRHLRAVEQARDARVVVTGRELLNFSSNDYLGLARHPEVIAALREAANEHGVGATAAHLICGHHREHAALEEELADWTGRERVLLFSSGWLANLGALQALLDRDGVGVQDKLNHASLLDAGKLAGCTLKRYRHADAEGASRQLKTADGTPALLATDGVFSMDGDIAPLRELATLCAREGAVLMVDDAHGMGVLGAHGEGSVAEAGLSQGEVPVLMATLGKALGCTGAFVAGSAALIEGLTQFARTYVYTTALPPALAAAARAAVRIAHNENWRREKLHSLIARFRRGALQIGLPLAESRTAIQPVLLGDVEATMRAAADLEDAGLLVGAIRPPAVPAGSARLRITFSAAHEEADVDRLLDALARVVPHPSKAASSL
ncbi:MAG TPA: 8-amino-7-oxononanoate synthase [Rhodanobacteraceae bacterium]|nr:8-amino-7-oxononanoate synthase [Rhodanobacteraceae bacterium]